MLDIPSECLIDPYGDQNRVVIKILSDSTWFAGAANVRLKRNALSQSVAKNMHMFVWRIL